MGFSTRAWLIAYPFALLSLPLPAAPTEPGFVPSVCPSSGLWVSAVAVFMEISPLLGDMGDIQGWDVAQF